MTMQSEPKGTVLVVDDDDAVRSGLFWALTSDYKVFQASSREEACTQINDDGDWTCTLRDPRAPA